MTRLIEAADSTAVEPDRTATPRWRRVRWYELVPEVLLVGGLGLFAAAEPRAALSAFRSNTAVVLMGGVVVAWITVRAMFFVVGGWPAMRFVVFTGAALAILRVVVLPAYQSHTVVEHRPGFGAQAPVSVPGLPMSGLPVSPATSPVSVSAAALHGIDHRASGTATIYRQPDGRFVVGLEDFDIQPGPAYALYVVPGADRRDLRDGIRIDALRGNKGTQYFDIPQGIPVTDGPWTVLVWCEIFDVPVANATPV